IIGEKASRVNYIILDVDGVLTDGSLILGTGGQEFKVFNSRDGLGIVKAIKKGLIFFIISGRSSEAVSKRAEELSITGVYQEVEDKLALYKMLKKKWDFVDEEAACIGDDLNDLPLLQRVGLSFTVADGVKEVKQNVDVILNKRGGRGAVREAIDLVLSFR
ncbi:MAG: KdsC family phosphatase, partial [Halanaerobiaceae bacterium]